MNAKLTVLGLFAVATFALPAHAESQSEWLLKQMSQTDGSTTTFDNQPATDSRAAKVKKIEVKKIAGPAEAAMTGTSDSGDTSEAAPKRPNRLPYLSDYPYSP